MAKRQCASSNRPEGPFTAATIETLLDRVAAKAYAIRCRLRQGQEIPTQRRGSRLVCFERAPRLVASVSVAKHSNRRADGQAALHLLVNFRQTPVCSAVEFEQALSEPTPERYRAMNKSLKSVTVSLECGGLPGPHRNPWQKAFRKANRWRFAPDQRPPLEECMSHLAKRGKTEAAEQLRKRLDDVPPGVQARRQRREALHWRQIWIHPERQKVQDVRFLLVLVLAQEGMIAQDSPIHHQAVGYLELEPATRPSRWDIQRGIAPHPDLIRRQVASRVWEGLLRYFDAPEDWRALRGYIARLAKMAKAEMLRGWGTGEQEDDNWQFPEVEAPPPDDEHDAFAEAWDDPRRLKKIKLPAEKKRVAVRLHSDFDTQGQEFTIREAAARLVQEGLSVRLNDLYRWIGKGCFTTRRYRGRQHLDGAGLEKARKLAKDREWRRKLRRDLINGGRKPEAAKKFLRRRLQAGKTLEEIDRELKEGRRP